MSDEGDNFDIEEEYNENSEFQESVNEANNQVNKYQEEINMDGPPPNPNSITEADARKSLSIMVSKLTGSTPTDQDLEGLITEINEGTEGEFSETSNKVQTSLKDFLASGMEKNKGIENDQETLTEMETQGGDSVLDLLKRIGPVLAGGIGIYAFLHELAKSMSGCYCSCPSEVGLQASQQCTPTCYSGNNPNTTCNSCTCNNVYNASKTSQGCSVQLTSPCSTNPTQGCACFWRHYTAFSLIPAAVKAGVQLAQQGAFDIKKLLITIGKYIGIALAIGFGIYIIKTLVDIFNKNPSVQ